MTNTTMGIYIDLLLVAAVTIYVVDVSGFTESWRHLLERMLHITRMRDLPPFDCGQCICSWLYSSKMIFLILITSLRMVMWDRFIFFPSFR